MSFPSSFSSSTSFLESHNPLISLRILIIDSYISTFSSLENVGTKKNNKFPILRIYGASLGGQKTCCHISGVFPYILVPCSLAQQSLQDYQYRLSISLEKALELRNSSSSSSSSSESYIYKSRLVSGKAFYGFRHENEIFIQLYFFQPSTVKLATELLAEGAVMGSKIDVFDAHISWPLQFMRDYHLSGCDFIHLSKAKFRREEGAPVSSGLLSRKHLDSIPHYRRTFNVTFLSSKLISETVKGTTTALEIDAKASDIIMSHESSVSNGLQSLWIDEKERRQIFGISIPLKESQSPPRTTSPLPSDNYWKDKFEVFLSKLSTKTETREKMHAEKQFPPSNIVENDIPSTTSQEWYSLDESIINEEIIKSSSSSTQQQDLSSEDIELIDILEDLQNNVEDSVETEEEEYMNELNDSFWDHFSISQ